MRGYLPTSRISTLYALYDSAKTAAQQQPEKKQVHAAMVLTKVLPVRIFL
ncbi:MAG: hypothetical protein IPJ66_06250 [Bacteroidetes bacterium]|nr:hypothetical protein [Bacteroidota bacterium]